MSTENIANLLNGEIARIDSLIELNPTPYSQECVLKEFCMYDMRDAGRFAGHLEGLYNLLKLLRSIEGKKITSSKLRVNNECGYETLQLVVTSE